MFRQKDTGPVGLDDGIAILDAVQVVVPTIQHALVEIVDKKPAFEGEAWYYIF